MAEGKPATLNNVLLYAQGLLGRVWWYRVLLSSGVQLRLRILGRGLETRRCPPSPHFYRLLCLLHSPRPFKGPFSFRTLQVMKSKELLEINISGLKFNIGEITKVLPTKCPQYNLHSILLLSGLMSPRVESAVDQVFLSQSQHQHMAGNMAHMCFTITQVSSG